MRKQKLHSYTTCAIETTSGRQTERNSSECREQDVRGVKSRKFFVEDETSAREEEEEVGFYRQDVLVLSWFNDLLERHCTLRTKSLLENSIFFVDLQMVARTKWLFGR